MEVRRIVCSSLMGCITLVAPSGFRRMFSKWTASLVRVNGMVSKYPSPTRSSRISALRASIGFVFPTVTVLGKSAARFS
ncbi:Uncharacterised protein [uncultured archaeon]|nr:Uncharacterised protein [uncultured archaeon]